MNSPDVLRFKDYIVNKKLRNYNKREFDSMREYVSSINPDRIFTYSDDQYYLQPILNGCEGEVYLVEEGTSMYTENECGFKKRIIAKYMSKVVYKDNGIKAFKYGESGNVDYVIARKPELVPFSGEKVKLSNDTLNYILNSGRSIEVDGGYLYCKFHLCEEFKEDLKVLINIKTGYF